MDCRYKGDTKLVASDRIVMEKEDTRRRLIIKQVVAKDAASYSCKATNVVGTANVSAKLSVKGQGSLRQWLLSLKFGIKIGRNSRKFWA